MLLFDTPDGRNAEFERILWPKLLPQRRDKALVAVFNEIFEVSAEGLARGSDEEVFVLFSDHSVSIGDMGDGARASLRMLMALALMQNTALLLEEPETHQHPAALR
jgi:hypothetical protein